jgi:hypothetical protein
MRRGSKSYEFKFGHGLGVFCKDPERVPIKFIEFLEEANASSEYEDLFYALGAAIEQA